MNNNNPYRMYKNATTYLDMVTPNLTPIHAIGTVVSPIPALIETPTKEDIKQYNKNDLASFLPFVSPYRLVKRRMAVSNELTKGKNVRKSLMSEVFGPIIVSAALTGAGAGIGYFLADRKAKNNPNIRDKKEYKQNAALLGALAGLGTNAIFNTAGTLSALFTKTRNTKEQTKYEKGKYLYNYLVPGYGIYNVFKNLGYANSQDKPGGMFAPDPIK